MTRADETRERVRLIGKKLAGTLTVAEAHRLDKMQARIAERHPRVTDRDFRRLETIARRYGVNRTERCR